MSNSLEVAAGPFKAQGLRLEERILQGTAPDQLPGYISGGSTSYLYAVEGRPNLVMRLPYAEEKFSSTPTQRVEEYMEPLARGLGHAGLEQVVAYSLRNPAITVSQKAGIKGLDEAKKDGTIARAQISSFVGLLATFRRMNKKLSLANEHPTPEHFRLNSAYNFTIIDYRVAEGWKQTLEEEVLYFAEPDSLVGDPADSDGKLPAYAKRYHIAVRFFMGNGMAKALQDEWRSDGFEIPRYWKLFV